ncbi:MAG TPA: aldo/keto reductase [Candidatus Cybelea sp.]|nr:aldo/keto reductase [Candidatus Cybelea sp.]
MKPPGSIPTIGLPDGTIVPRLGLGTWRMGESRARRAAEVAALKLGIELGFALIDTAEMYGEGGAEEIVAEATAGLRDRMFLVSKVYPHNASRGGVVAACERSLKRLKTDRLDLYLLHWLGSVPLSETVAGFGDLVAAGKIRRWGVSNLDAGEMRVLSEIAGGEACQTNQVLYNLARRGIEWDVLPWCRKRHMPVMAYSPLDQGRILDHRALKRIAARYGATPAQVALKWLIDREGVFTIPKAASPAHVRDIRSAVSLALDAGDRAELDKAFPPPKRAAPLEML